MLDRRVEARERLVEQQQPRAARDRARHQHAATLPAREPPDLAAGQVGEADALDGLGGVVAVLGGPAAERTGMAPAAHQHDVAHADREVPVDLVDLGHVGDVGARLSDGAAEDADLAAQRADEAEDRLEERRLARAVRSDDADELALGHDEVDGLDRGRLAGVAGPEVVHLEG